MVWESILQDSQIIFDDERSPFYEVFNLWVAFSVEWGADVRRYKVVTLDRVSDRSGVGGWGEGEVGGGGEVGVGGV